jgi:hypothetical protein
MPAVGPVLRRRPLRELVTTGVIVLLLAGHAGSQEAPAAEPPARDGGRFRHRPASANYVDEESRFSLQGYATGVFSDFGPDFPQLGFPPPGQLLVSRTADSSFQYDWALFLGSRLSDRLSFVVETHFVTAPDGDFRPVIVTTEALVVWSPLSDRHALRIALGEYWAPFAGVNDDWLSAVNRFAILPLASRAFPAHYNERGVRLEGEFDLGGNRGLNYALSAGNGVSGMGIDDQSGFDANGDKAVMGRVGFFPTGTDLEIGLSAFTGRFREALDASLPASEPRRYPARFEAYGVDARYRRPRVELRGYGILSYERLEGADVLRRWGTLVEAVVQPLASRPLLRRFWLKARWDRSLLDRLDGLSDDDQVWNAGLEYRIESRARLSVSGFFHEEREGPRLRDNGVVVQLTASF